MAASTSVLQQNNSSDAIFRAWVQAIINALAAGGLVRVHDTGEINELTVTAPSGTNQDRGWVIFRSNDAAGGLHNWYIKIGFGSGAATQNPSLWVGVGWGTNGSGTLTGTNTLAYTQFAAAGTTASPTTYDCNLAAGTGWLAICMWCINYPLLLSVERVRDTNGAETDDIFVYAARYNTNTVFNTVVRYSGTAGANISTSPGSNGSGWLHQINGNGSYASNFGVGSLAPQLGGFLPFCLNLLSGNTTNFNSAQATFTITAYGATHTYINNKDAGIVGGSMYSLMRFE